MTSDRHIGILVDAREFVQGRFTGIARVLQGLSESLADADFTGQVSLAVQEPSAVPSSLKAHSENIVSSAAPSFLEVGEGSL